MHMYMCPVSTFHSVGSTAALCFRNWPIYIVWILIKGVYPANLNSCLFKWLFVLAPGKQQNIHFFFWGGGEVHFCLWGICCVTWPDLGMQDIFHIPVPGTFLIRPSFSLSLKVKYGLSAAGSENTVLVSKVKCFLYKSKTPDSQRNSDIG